MQENVYMCVCVCMHEKMKKEKNYDKILSPKGGKFIRHVVKILCNKAALKHTMNICIRAWIEYILIYIVPSRRK